VLNSQLELGAFFVKRGVGWQSKLDMIVRGLMNDLNEKIIKNYQISTGKQVLNPSPMLS
jgi:hypothetical protein